MCLNCLSTLKTDLQALLQDPAKLGQFLCDAAEISELEKVAREEAIMLLLRQEAVPGWLLRRRENSYVLPSALEPLLTESPDTILQAFGSISERRYRELCRRGGVTRDPGAIIKSGTTAVLAKASH